MHANARGAVDRGATRCLLALALAATWCGCKSAPVNPFSAQAQSDSAAPEQAAPTTADAASTPPLDAQAQAAQSMYAQDGQLTRLGNGVALAAVGLGKEVGAAAKDAVSRVRLAAAQTLSRESEEARRVAAQTAASAQQIAREAGTQAQLEAIQALEQWPIERAGPVLLVAIAEGGYTARKAAAAQLAARWSPAANFPVEAAAESRAAALAELRKLWIAQYGEINDAVISRMDEARQLIELSAERIAEARQLVAKLAQADLPEASRRQLIATLISVGPPLVSVLDAQLEAAGVLPPAIYTDVLPAIGPTFVTLVQLSTGDVARKREAAAALAEQAAGTVLPPTAVARLAELMRTENDPQVWQSALAAIRGSAHHTAIRMAYQGLAHTSPEVRAAACLYLAAHGDPRHTNILMRALTDAEPVVQRAALRALGAAGTLEDARPVIEFLASPDKDLRVEAALSLARLRVAEGTAALERMALDTDYEIRLRAAQAMGEIADPLFLPALVAMLGDQTEVQHAAMRSMARIAGTDVAAGAEGSDAEKVRRWQRWYAERTEVANRGESDSAPRR